MPNADQFAAVDLGSNSFHMVIAKVENGQLRVIDRLREQVQLGLGMGEDKKISDDARQRGLDCLATFGQRLRGIPPLNCRIVGTNTLRRAANGAAFVAEANALLGHDVEIISGREEARLIYEGVLHNAPEPNTARLVIDIGGGSTEIIVGNGFDPSVMESISAGCVSMSQQYFASSKITAGAMRKASSATLMEFHPVMHKYRQAPWTQAVGCSGTIKAINSVVHQLGFCKGDGFSAEALSKLASHMQKIGHIERLDYEGLPSRRLAVLPGGVAVLQALFKALKIEHMAVSETALREGVIYDLYGVQRHADVQQNTLLHLAKQYKIDTAQASRVQRTAGRLLNGSGLDERISAADKQLLRFACQLYETGWVVAHSQYHKHGHYLLAHSDMRGFSRTEQLELANLVRYHRRKLPQPLDKVFSEAQQSSLLLLRLAVIINRDRLDQVAAPVAVRFTSRGARIDVDSLWLEKNPLSAAEIKNECAEWAKADFRLRLNDEAAN